MMKKKKKRRMQLEIRAQRVQGEKVVIVGKRLIEGERRKRSW